MALHEVQEVLARLYTDRAFRVAFFADRERALQSAQWTEADRAVLLQIQEAQVERFARSLHKKRRVETLPLLPWLAARLSETFETHFEAHCNRYQPTGLRKPGEDALAFCQEISAKTTLDALTRALARWEAARWEHLLDRASWRFQIFSCCPCASRSEAGDLVYTVVPGRTFVLRWRGKWRALSLRFPSGVSFLANPHR
jgi:hypothetical protein